jgi:hypothetical protein
MADAGGEAERPPLALVGASIQSFLVERSKATLRYARLVAIQSRGSARSARRAPRGSLRSAWRLPFARSPAIFSRLKAGALQAGA